MEQPKIDEHKFLILTRQHPLHHLREIGVLLVERHQGLGLFNGLNERILQFELRLDGMDYTLLELA